MIYRRPGLNQASFDHPCSKISLRSDYASGPRQVSTTVEKKCSLVPSLFSVVVFMYEQLEGLRPGYNCTITSVLPLLGKPFPAPFQNGMRFGWLLLADTQAFLPRSCRLWKSLPTRFLVQRSVARSQAVSPCLLTCSGKTVIGPCRHLLVRLLWSCRA